jgi:phosphoglycolate phosphatase-like HAD superfamily hydrolase
VKCLDYGIFRVTAAGVDDVKQVLNVGDTPLDIQTGHRAGVLGTIAVLTGVHNEARLLAESPKHSIASVAELPSLIESRYS